MENSYVYPSGGYIIGKDLQAGSYIFKSKDGKSASVIQYKSYKHFRNEGNEFSWNEFEYEFHLSFYENDVYIVVEDATFQKIN